jgi:hypothetical protein
MPTLFAPSKKDLYERQIVAKIFKFAHSHKSIDVAVGRAVDITVQSSEAQYDRLVLNSDEIYGSIDLEQEKAEITEKDMYELLRQLNNPFKSLSIIVTNQINHLELVIDSEKNIRVFTKIGPDDEISLETLKAREDIDAEFIQSLIKPLQNYLKRDLEEDLGCVQSMSNS